jgi:hypothetical protein
MPPLRPNPLKVERKRLGITIETLCYRANISKSLVIKNEQGTYPLPSPTILAYFTNEDPDFDSASCSADYRTWQRDKRESSYGLLSPTFNLTYYLRGLPVGDEDELRGDEPYIHPLEYWRINSLHRPNLNMLSKGFCLQQSLLFKFEQQAHLVNSVPDPICHALLEAGYDRRVLSDLETAYTEYKQYFRNLSLRVDISGIDRSADSVTRLL